MKAVLCALVIIVIVPTLLVFGPLLAQTTRLQSPMRPVTERIQPWDCELPAVPGMASQKVDTKVGMLIEWCAVNLALALAHMCRGPQNISDATLCYAVLPLATTTALMQPGPHVLHIASIAVNEGVPLSLQVEQLYCLADGMRYPVGATLPPPPTLPNGNLQSTLGAFTIQNRIGRLRADGWRIEWDRAQFAVAPVTGGIWAVLGWCEGVPQ